MTAKNTGIEFEKRAYEALKELLIHEALGLSPRHCEIFTRKGYYSRDRNSEIIFDIAIEMSLQQSLGYSLIWLWECKDYRHAVPVDDVEEFYAKVQQVTGVNAKAGIITSASLQEGALNFALSKRMSVVRLLHSDQVLWVAAAANGTDSGLREIERARNSARQALLEQNYNNAVNNDLFILSDGEYFDDPVDFVGSVYDMTNEDKILFGENWFRLPS